MKVTRNFLGRIGLGREVLGISRAGSGGFQASRVGPGRSDSIESARSDPTRVMPKSLILFHPGFFPGDDPTH